MKIFILVCVTLLGLSSTVPVEQVLNQDVAVRDDNAGLIETAIRELLDQIRDVLINGREDIPVMDPLQIEHLELGQYWATLAISDFVMSNLSSFEVPHLNVRQIRILPTMLFLFEMDGHIPTVDINVGNYDLNISVPGTNVRLFGKGSASVTFANPRIKGDMTLRLSVIGFRIELVESNLRFHLESFVSNITGFLNDDGISNFINAFLGYLIPDLIYYFKEDIATIINTIIMEIGNEILANNINPMFEKLSQLN